MPKRRPYDKSPEATLRREADKMLADDRRQSEDRSIKSRQGFYSPEQLELREDRERPSGLL